METTTTVSKKSIAGATYDQLASQGKTRKEIIAAMMDSASLTLNGASTYYTNFKGGSWSTTTQPRKTAVQSKQTAESKASGMHALLAGWSTPVSTTD